MTLNGITASSVIFIAPRYDSALLSILCPSVRTCLSQAGNGMVSKWLTDRAGIWHGGFLPSTLCIVKKFRQAYLPNNGTSLWNFVHVPNYRLGNFVTEVVQCIVNKTRRRLSLLTRLTIVVALAGWSMLYAHSLRIYSSLHVCGPQNNEGSQPPDWTITRQVSHSYATVTTRSLVTRVSVTAWLAERNHRGETRLKDLSKFTNFLRSLLGYWCSIIEWCSTSSGPMYSNGSVQFIHSRPTDLHFSSVQFADQCGHPIGIRVQKKWGTATFAVGWNGWSRFRLIGSTGWHLGLGLEGLAYITRWLLCSGAQWQYSYWATVVLTEQSTLLSTFAHGPINL